MINKRYAIAIDGTQKFMRTEKWLQECLERHVGKEKQEQYYVYVLESVVIFDNGITLPLMSEFLNNDEYKEIGSDKQDCERKAFYRFSKKVKASFPKLKIAVTMDVLYACGPVIKICSDYGWDFMLVFKEGSMKDTWEETSKTTGKIESKSTRYIWISGKEPTKSNVENRCIKIGRYRWKIENNFLVVKHPGYQYEHCFSYNWNAMVGFHHLMKIGRFINVLLVNSEFLAEKVDELGIRGLIAFIFKACTGYILDIVRLSSISKDDSYQWRLVRQ